MARERVLCALVAVSRVRNAGICDSPKAAQKCARARWHHKRTLLTFIAFLHHTSLLAELRPLIDLRSSKDPYKRTHSPSTLFFRRFSLPQLGAIQDGDNAARLAALFGADASVALLVIFARVLAGPATR